MGNPPEGQFGQTPPEMPELTEEQQAEMEARRAEMDAQRAEMESERTAQQEAWNALTDAQKEEIYALQDQSIDTEIATIDKYLSFGLLSEDAAAEMKASLEEKKAAIRENGMLPFAGAKGGMHGKKGGHMRPPMPFNESEIDPAGI
jgi:septal ring factor EnvC (AmiA/AmiB activator)